MERSAPALTGRSCATCRFCGTQMAPTGALRTICRRHPPRAHGTHIATGPQQVISVTNAMWPEVDRNDWCGEHAPQIQ